MSEPISRSVVFTQFNYLSHILKFYVSDEKHLMNAMHVSRNWTDYVLSKHSLDFEKEVVSPNGTKSFVKLKSTKALYRAVHYGFFHFIDRCLNNYPEMILKRNKRARSLLFLSMNDMDMFRFLFEKCMEIDENGVIKRDHIYHHAVQHGRIEIVRLLIEKGIEQHGDSQNNYPLHIAAHYGQLEIALLLLDRKGSLNVYGETPLSIAMDKGNYEMSKVLLDNGANPSHRDTKGESLLHKTIDRKDNEYSHLLLDYLADVTYKNNLGLTPFFKLIHSHNPDLNLVKKFLMRGIREQHLWGLFCHSVRMKYYEIVEMMLEFVGADLMRLSRNDVLQIPLRSATTDKDEKMILTFRKHQLYNLKGVALH